MRSTAARPFRPNNSLVADAGKAVRLRAGEPALRQEEFHELHQREGANRKRTISPTTGRISGQPLSNKQLNFVQHIRTMLKTTGRAAVVVPDNVLFEGGAGETIRKKLLHNTDLHTILRLPTGGVLRPRGQGQCDVLRQSRSQPESLDEQEVWYYDYRTNIHHTLKKKSMRFGDLSDFHRVLQPAEPVPAQGDLGRNMTRRTAAGAAYSYEELTARDKTSLDIFWLKDKSLTDLDNLPEPNELAEEIIENLEAGLNSFREVLAGLRQNKPCPCRALVGQVFFPSG